MKIRPDDKLTSMPGAFGDTDGDATLRVSPPVFQVTRQLGTPTAEALYDAARESPATLAQMLRWSTEQVEVATGRLEAAIAKARPGYFDEPLEPPQSVVRGAMPPRRR